MRPGAEAVALGERRGLDRSLAAGPSPGVRRTACLAVILVSMAMLCRGQSTVHMPIHDQAAPELTDDGMPSANRAFGGNVGDPVFMERRLRQLNAAQHKSMVSDTDRLVKLVKELHAEIGSSTPKALTDEQLRKVAEIEKLAHSVKDKMRITVQPAAPSRMDAASHSRVY